MRPILSRSTLDESELAALGSVVVESTYSEVLVDTLIQELSGLKKPQLILFLRGAMINTKLELLGELAKLKLKSQRRRKKFADLITNLKTLNSERVIAVHGMWSRTVVSDKARKSLADWISPTGPAEALHPRGGKISARRLDVLAMKISEAYWDLYDFHVNVWVRPYLGRSMKRLRAISRAVFVPPS